MLMYHTCVSAQTYLSIVSTAPKLMVKLVPGKMLLGADTIVGRTPPFCKYLRYHLQISIRSEITWKHFFFATSFAHVGTKVNSS